MHAGLLAVAVDEFVAGDVVEGFVFASWQSVDNLDCERKFAWGTVDIIRVEYASGSTAVYELALFFYLFAAARFAYVVAPPATQWGEGALEFGGVLRLTHEDEGLLLTGHELIESGGDALVVDALLLVDAVFVGALAPEDRTGPA